jgi:Protein of unknown function (DUF3140)
MSETRFKADDRDQVYFEFRERVNMAPKDLEGWLRTDESKSVGEGSGESKGHRSGRRIVEILGKRKGDLTASDVDHMRRVTGYIGRHLAQRPSGDVEDSAWRHSLMNWGHDPLK